VFAIGGSPCAGKSSIARLIAARHGLSLFECDAGAEARRARMGVRPDDVGRRLARPPRQQADREIEFYRAQFEFLRAELPAAGLAEGADLMPELLHRAGIPMNRAIWIVPTPEFQRRFYAGREWVAPYLKDCADPAQAFENWMQRDILFARYISRTAADLGGTVLVVDGSRTIADNAALVERHFGLS
jgi:hypothetical protein